MEQRAPQEYVLEIFADQTFVKDIVKGQYSLNLMGVVIEADF